MYKIFVNCKRYFNKIHFVMRILFISLFLMSFLSCEKNETNNLLIEPNISKTIYLNNAEFIELQIPSNWVYTTGGIKGILIQNSGIGSPPYKAFDRACPNNDCSSPMTFDGSLRMKCSCDESEYSILDGSPQTSGNTHFALEYKVVVISSSELVITNY